jgi:hypothetical protein
MEDRVDWPIDDLVTMEADQVSRWLAGRGLPGVTLLFWDPHGQGFASWREVGEADRRHVLDAIGAAVAAGTRLPASGPAGSVEQDCPRRIA